MNEPPVQSHVESTPAPSDQWEQGPGPDFKEVFLRLGPAGYLALAWASLPVLGSILLWLNIGLIGTWLRGRGGEGLAIYVILFMLTAGLGLLPTYVQAILGGWAFGVLSGFPAALAGVTGAASVGYLVARMASENRAELIIAESPKARAVRDSLIGHGFWKTLGIVTLLRIPLNSPFAITNLAMASAGVPKRIFLIGAALGMAPRTGLAVYLAAGVKELNRTAVQEAGPPWLKIAAIGSLVFAFGLVIWIGDRAVKKITRAEPPHMVPR